MKSNLTLISLILLFASAAMAQNAAIDSAAAMIKRNEFSAANRTLTAALQDSAKLSEKEIATVHCMLSEALFSEGKTSVDETRYREGVSANYMGFLTGSFSHIMAATKVTDAGVGLQRKLDSQVRVLKLGLMHAANQNFQGLSAQDDSLIQQQLMDRNLLCTSYMLALDSTYHLAHNYMARTLLSKGEHARARDILEIGLKSYLTTERREPDILALEMIMQLAKVQMRYLDQPDLAKKTVADGLALLDVEDELVTNNTGMTQMRKDRMFDKIDEVRDALKELSSQLEE